MAEFIVTVLLICLLFELVPIIADYLADVELFRRQDEDGE